MFLLTETTLFHLDLAFDLLSARLNNVKKEFSGAVTARKVQTKGLPLRSVGSLGSSHSYVTTITNTEATDSSGTDVKIWWDLKTHNVHSGFLCVQGKCSVVHSR
jgi:hypothetical protein